MKKRISLNVCMALLIAATALASTGSPGTGPAQWRAKFATDANTMHKNVFPGVDLIFSGAHTRISAQLIVNPGAKLDAIRLDLTGAEQAQIGQEVTAVLPADKLSMRVQAPQIFQALKGKKLDIAGSFVQRPDGSFGIAVKEYDRRQPLIITLVTVFQATAKAEVAKQEIKEATPTAVSAVDISATKTDEIIPDAPPAGQADPGETIKYTVIIQNSGSTDATAVDYDETVDTNTSLTGGTLKTTPLAYSQTVTILEGAATPITLTGNDADGGNLTFALTSSPAKGGTGSVTQNPPSSATVTYTPNTDANDNTAPAGADGFNFKVTDADANIDNATVTINITPVNDAPTFSCGADQTHTTASGPAITVTGWATGIAAGPATATDETSQVLTFNLTGNTNPSIFSVNPAVNSSNGNLTYTLAGTAGQSTISFTLSDNGGTANSGANTSAPCSFIVTVNGAPLAVDDPNGGLPGNSTPSNDGPAPATDHPYHTALNTTLTVSDGANDLLANDNLGFPAGAIFSYGTTGNVTAQISIGSPTATNQGGTVTVQVNGSFSYTPPSATFTGLDQFAYRLQNVAGSDDATVTIAVGVRPAAVADAFTATGNIAIAHSAGQIHANNGSGVDLGDQITVTQVQGVGGNVGVATATNQTGRGSVTGFITLNANGSFTYEPPPGFEGNDTFTYTVGNGFGNSSSATVTITISNMVWFISNNAGGSNRGTFNNPFTSIASFNTANAGTGAIPDPKNSDRIALRTGSGTYAETDGINLRTSQILIGEAVQFNTVFTANANSISAYNTFASGTMAAPQITASAGNGVDLASGNTVRGLDVGNTSGFGFNGTAVGSPTINTVNKTGNGGAINVSTSGSFGSNVTFNTLSSTNSAAEAIKLVGVTGTLGVTAGTITNPADTAICVIGGSVSMTYPGNITQSNNVSTLAVLNGHTGTLTFQTGTINVTNGNGLQFDNADGTYNFNSTTTLNGGDAGVDILNGSTGTFSFSSGTSITRANGVSGAAFNLLSSNAGVTYDGSMTLGTSTGNMVAIDNHDAGTITFNTGNLTKGSSTTQGISISNSNGGSISFNNPTITITMTSGNAVSLTSNTSSTINFAIAGSGMDLTTTSGTGFNATGGGTVSVTGSGNTISSTTGTALNVVSTTIGASGLTFQTISHNGGTNGIVLNSTGSNGGLTVTGTGSAGTGGTIQNATGAGIILTSTINVSLSYMNVQNGGDDGIQGSSVTGFTLSNCNVTGNGNAVTERGVEITNLLGTASISSSSVSNNAEDNLYVVNNTGTLTLLTVTNSTFSNTSATVGNDGIHFRGEVGSPNMSISVSNCTFANNRGDHFQATTDASNTAVMDVVFQSNTLTGAAGNLGAGITINTASNSDLTFDVSGNNIQGAVSSAININLGTGTPGTASLSGTINNNTIGTAGTTDSGSSQGDGVTVFSNSLGATTVAITNNTIRQYSNLAGIQLHQRDGNGSLHATITGNTIANPGSFASNGILAQAGAIAADAGFLCVDIGGAVALANSIAGSGGGGDDFRVRQRFGTTVRLPNYGGLSTDTAAVVAFIQGRNTGIETGSATVQAPGGGFVGGAACNQP